MRLGTIGTGEIVHHILDAAAGVEGITCEAVYSRSLDRGRLLADQYGVNKVYTDITEIMEDERVDFIYVASPNSLHYDHARMALEHGKHVICEKPFTSALAQAKELIQCAREKGLFLFDAVPPSFLPNFRAVKEQLCQIGKIKLVMSNYSQYSSRYDQLLEGKVPNVFSREYAGGCLQDIGFYNLYFNISMFGKPQTAIYYPNLYRGQIDTSGVLVLQYPEFVSSNVCAKDTWGINFVQVEGEDGYMYIKGGSNALTEIKVVTREKENVINLQEDIPRWAYEMEEIFKIVEQRDYDACYERLDTTMDVIGVLEKVRRDAGIY